MDPEEYQQLIRSKRVLDYGTLKVTLEELEKLGDKRLLTEIERILANNVIEKPKYHNQANNRETDHYRIDLDDNDIDTIVSMFGDKEVSSLGSNYEATRAACFYATMLDNWNRMTLD